MLRCTLPTSFRRRLATLAVLALAAPAPAAGDSPGSPTGGARVIPFPGGAVKVWNAAGPGGDRLPHYAIARDGVNFDAPRATNYVIKLRHGHFDPLAAAPAPAIEAGFAAGRDTNVYIVQFVTQPLEGYRAAIRDLGGTVYFFLANHSHIVMMDRETRGAVEDLPFVRWVGPLHPAYRLDESMLHDFERGSELFPLQRYNIMLFESAMAYKQAVAARIEAIGGAVDMVHAGKYLMQATLTPEQLSQVARLDQVAFIDPWGALEADMDIARQIGGADFIEETPGNYTGKDVRGEVLDVGFNVGHDDFASRPLIEHTSITSNSHGASTSGICFGDGASNATARGMLPDGQGIVAGSQVMTGQARYDHTAELLEPPYEAVFQTASVGSPRTRDYTTISADMDALLFDLDIVLCQSQSNAGNQDSRPEAWAKNIISGGGVYHRGTLQKSDDVFNGGATQGSTGPAADGRIKPTLTHFYDLIFTVSCCGASSYTSGFGGTSGATPIICGYVGLFFEMWDDGIFGNDVDPDGSVFDNRCHMTTCKAMLVNSASPYDWNGPDNADLTRFRQGWGMPDLQNLYDLRESMLIVDETDLVTNGATNTYEVDVPEGVVADPLRVTLVFADPAGVPFSDQHRINDLSLKVTAPDDTVYWGNAGLIDGIWSTPGGSANEIDTVENVFIKRPDAGRYTVQVIATEINQDSHVETQELDADYALVISGISLGCAGDVDEDGEVDFDDLLLLLAAWGPCEDCPADIDGDGDVTFQDLLQLLSGWGPC